MREAGQFSLPCLAGLSGISPMADCLHDVFRYVRWTFSVCPSIESRLRLACSGAAFALAFWMKQVAAIQIIFLGSYLFGGRCLQAPELSTAAFS